MPEDPRVWEAKWIAYAYDPREDIGVFGFRRKLDLDRVPESLKVRVSADNRYKLYVNGEFVGFGPQRGDPMHWFYETYDLAPFLKVGENWIAALVWNFGRWAPMAQMSARTGFVLSECGIGEVECSSDTPAGSSGPHPTSQIQHTLSTPNGWQVARLDNWSFDMMHSHDPNYYIDVGPGELIDFRGAPWGWRTGQETPLPPSSKGEGGRGKGVAWREPHTICRAEERGAGGGGTPWMLVPRSIPAMRYELWTGKPTVRHGFEGDADGSPPDARRPKPDASGPDARSSSPDAVFPTFLQPGKPLLLDFGELLCAYPRITIEGPPGAVVTLTYAESLWGPDGTKVNRDDVAGKRMAGYQDKLILDGEKRTIETLWWRTWRYLMVEVADNSDHPLPPAPSPFEEGGRGVVVHSLEAIETGYPLEAESSFEADDPWVKPIWDVSLRTARRCAGETYFDCPYWEQLQYVGDTRIQALIGYYLGRDRALQRNAVETLGWSLMENGLTQSRYPSRQVQVIPPFSLWWVMMLYDQMLYDQRPSEQHLAAAKAINQAYKRFADQSQFWNFADWIPTWSGGVPPPETRLIHLQRVMAVVSEPNAYLEVFDMSGKERAKLEKSGERFLKTFVGAIDRYEKETAGKLGRAVKDHEFAALRKPDEIPTEHAEALSRLLELWAEREPGPWPTDALAKANAAKCTYYFSYYKHLAMFGRPAGEWQGDPSYEPGMRHHAYPFDYMAELQPWKQMIEDGLTTFAENPEPTRSDCHAWSAHPILGFFQIVAGVTSTAPGWKKARIMPHPGSLRRFDARVAHPDGELRVRFQDGKLEIDSPVPFELRWQDRRESFPAGKAEA